MSAFTPKVSSLEWLWSGRSGWDGWFDPSVFRGDRTSSNVCGDQRGNG